MVKEKKRQQPRSSGRVLPSRITTADDLKFVTRVERDLTDELRRISTLDTDPELEHVAKESRVRDRHHRVLILLRNSEV